MMCSLDLILVIIERASPSVPFRTRQGKAVSPMVLWLKPRKSRSSPELNLNDMKTVLTAHVAVFLTEKGNKRKRG